MTSPDGIHKLTRAYTGFQVSFSLMLWLPIFYEYQRQAGLVDREIFGIQSLYYAAFCLLAVPTGMLSDRFGYRRSLIGGAVLLLASNFLAIFARSYWGFVGHFMFIASARSLVLGASSAYLYDSLLARGQAALYKEIEGKARASGLILKIVCWAGIGFLMQAHATLPYWLSAGTAGLAVWSALGLPADPGRAPSVRRREALPDLLAAFRALRASPLLLFVMVQGVAIFVLDRISQVNLFQPILKDKAFALTMFGLISSGTAVFEAMGSARAPLLRRYLSDREAVLVLAMAMAGSLALVPWVGQAGTLLCLAAYAMASGLAFPIQKQLMNDAIPDSRYRATLLSVEQLLDRAVCAGVAYVLAGFLGAAGGLDRFLVLSAGTAAGVAAVLFIVQRVQWRFKRFDKGALTPLRLLDP